MTFSLLKLLHLTCLLFLLSASTYKNIKVHMQQCEHKDLKRILIADSISGLAATLMLVSGVAMLVHNYPHPLFRLQLPSFWGKIVVLSFTTTLIIMSKLSLRKLAKASVRDSQKSIRIPQSIKWILGIDLAGLGLMAVLASIMVRW